MAHFIEIKPKDGKRRFINVNFIEEVCEDELGCFIYLGFNCPDSIEQDYFKVDESYESIVSKIKKSKI